MRTMDTYRGYTEYRFSSDEEMAAFYQGETPGGFPELLRNEYIYLRDPAGSIVDKLCWGGTKFRQVNTSPVKTTWMGSVTARNPEQELVLDLLRDKSTTVKLVTGKFGSGKTYLMTAAAVQMLERGKIDRVLFIRNNVQVKDVPEIGFLPGNVNDKLLWCAMPMADALGGVDGLNDMMAQGKISIVPLGMVRGRDFNNTLIFCSECENLTYEQARLIITRAANNSQVWFDGDMAQVDKPVYEKNSAIKRMIDRLSGQELFGYVQLQKTERSKTAEMADLLI